MLSRFSKVTTEDSYGKKKELILKKTCFLIFCFYFIVIQLYTFEKAFCVAEIIFPD